jgi:UDPglucose 6-dehydrogenase
MRTQRIAVIGTGYVGLTAGACFASLGHRVSCLDTDAAKIARLGRAEVDIYEPGLAELVRDGAEAGRLTFTTDAATAVSDARVVFLCLPTPMTADGDADLSIVESAAGALRDLLPSGCVVVTKSTVPVGTAARVSGWLGRPDVPVVANPEFLREGQAARDFLRPDRIVIGARRAETAELVADLYAGITAPVVVTDPASAELAKYVSNCFLAMKLSYVNMVAELCETFGADSGDVLRAVGLDPRIGRAFLRPGPGWGGSCLPKDAHALAFAAAQVGVDYSLLTATITTNARQVGRMTAKVRAAAGGTLAGARIGLLGLTFKAGTDDVRDSPAVAIAHRLLAAGADVTAYDPHANTDETAAMMVDDPYAVAKEADVVVLLTEWPMFRELDWERMANLMRRPVVVDTRNHLDSGELARCRIRLVSTGRQ